MTIHKHSKLKWPIWVCLQESGLRTQGQDFRWIILPWVTLWSKLPDNRQSPNLVWHWSISKRWCRPVACLFFKPIHYNEPNPRRYQTPLLSRRPPNLSLTAVPLFFMISPPHPHAASKSQPRHKGTQRRPGGSESCISSAAARRIGSRAFSSRTVEERGS